MFPLLHSTAANIKIVASKLDFEARPRKTRDGCKEIEIHDRKLPHELLMFSIFDLSNRVFKGRALSSQDRNSARSNCAKILFYDHGYKKVTGLSNLEREWETKLELAYISGADTNPFHRSYEGQVSYTDTMESQHPGLLTQLYEYADESIGEKASYRDKAAFMNEKSKEDAEIDPALPVFKLNSINLRNWVLKKKTGANPVSDKSKRADADLSLIEIEKKHPGLIEDLYTFAEEALGVGASYHMLATCMNERSKEDAEEDPTVPLVTVSKLTLPSWIKKKGLY